MWVAPDDFPAMKARHTSLVWRGQRPRHGGFVRPDRHPSYHRRSQEKRQTKRPTSTIMFTSAAIQTSTCSAGRRRGDELPGCGNALASKFPAVGVDCLKRGVLPILPATPQEISGFSRADGGRRWSSLSSRSKKSEKAEKQTHQTQHQEAS